NRRDAAGPAARGRGRLRVHGIFPERDFQKVRARAQGESLVLAQRRNQAHQKTRLRYHGGMHSAFEKTPHCILKLLVERLVSYGLTLTRTSNCWNDYSAFREEIAELKKNGMDTVANLIYSVSPRHTDEYYARKAREAAAAAPWRICIKDVGGLLTPERARTLIPVVLEAAGAIPVEFHAHCNSGHAPVNYLEGVKLGMRILHTAIPPLANGSSQ